MARVAWQPQLFGASAAPPVDRAFATRERIALDDGSWVEIVSRWLADPDALFARLLDACAWEQRKRYMYTGLVTEPRLTAEIPSLDASPSSLVREAADALSTRYGVRYDSVWLNLYRDGRDSTAWHGDHISCKRDDCVVPVLTLGATRRFLLKPKDGGKSHVFQPAAGDLVVMGGRCQVDWVHAVPKTARPSAARISLNFMSSEQGREPNRR